jgi:hypothetical protein
MSLATLDKRELHKLASYFRITTYDEVDEPA